MDLQKEYLERHGLVDVGYVFYPTRGNVVLRRQNNVIHISIERVEEKQGPCVFRLIIRSNPIIYTDASFSSYSLDYSEILLDKKCDWDNYEATLLKWVNDHRDGTEVIAWEEAIFLMWKLFLISYDVWIANFVPFYLVEKICESLTITDVNKRQVLISEIATWLQKRYDRVFTSWRNISMVFSKENYSDWLVTIFKA